MLLGKRNNTLFWCFDLHTKFKRFTKRWLKYGQNFIENQKLLKNVGEVKFLKYYNKRIHNQLTNNDKNQE